MTPGSITITETRSAKKQLVISDCQGEAGELRLNVHIKMRSVFSSLRRSEEINRSKEHT